MEKYNGQNKEVARKNRKQRNATRQEGILWHCYLKKCPINFSRQYRIHNYIVDFFAPSVKLAIELDGGQHFEPERKQYDIIRTQELNALGIVVLRFTNTDIDKHLNRTIEQIVTVLEKLTGKPLY